VARCSSPHITVGLRSAALDLPLVSWVNDGLMAIFVFVVGLEIKRELLRGELASRRKAALPAFAALGDMAVPALIFVAFNLGRDGQRGWGIPMATDIAFAVGVISLAGPRAPLPLKVFLLALAIVDDLGAIAVIAIFYTEGVALGWLAGAAALFGLTICSVAPACATQRSTRRSASRRGSPCTSPACTQPSPA